MHPSAFAPRHLNLLFHSSPPPLSRRPAGSICRLSGSSLDGGGRQVSLCPGCNKLYLCSAPPVSAGSPCLPPGLTHWAANAFTLHRCEKTTLCVLPCQFVLLFVGSLVFRMQVNFHEFYWAAAGSWFGSQRESCVASPTHLFPRLLTCDWDPEIHSVRPIFTTRRPYLHILLFAQSLLHCKKLERSGSFEASLFCCSNVK